MLRNTIRCSVCKDVILSNSVHDFKHCTCGESFVDGGMEYFRCGGNGVEVEDDKIKCVLVPMVDTYFYFPFKDMIYAVTKVGRNEIHFNPIEKLAPSIVLGFDGFFNLLANEFIIPLEV